MPSSWQWRMLRTVGRMTTGTLREHSQEDGMEFGSSYYLSRSVEIHRKTKCSNDVSVCRYK